MTSEEGLKPFAFLPTCQIDEWMPSGAEIKCQEESVRRVWSKACKDKDVLYPLRQFWLCRKDADFVESYHAKHPDEFHRPDGSEVEIA